MSSANVASFGAARPFLILLLFYYYYYYYYSKNKCLEWLGVEINATGTKAAVEAKNYY